LHNFLPILRIFGFGSIISKTQKSLKSAKSCANEMMLFELKGTFILFIRMQEYLRIAYIKYKQKTCTHDYLQLCIVKPKYTKNRSYREIYYSQRYNIAIHSKEYMLETINMLKKNYQVDKVILSSTKKYPTEVNDYFKGICL